MKVTCSYCGKTIKTVGDDPLVSHGVCSDCLPDILSHHDITVEDYLESVPYPAVLVNDDGEVIASNKLYRSKLGEDTDTTTTLLEGRPTVKDDSSPTGHSYAGTNTVRMLIREALKSKVDSAPTTATAKISRGGRRGRVNMLIGTHRIGETMIVEIEDIVSVQWYSATSTGHQELDRQHFEMDQLLHRMASANFNDGVALMDALLRGLKTHFEFEENVVVQGKLLVGSEHRAAHTALLDCIVAILRSIQDSGDADFGQVSQEVAELLMEHVDTYDQLLTTQDTPPSNEKSPG